MSIASQPKVYSLDDVAVAKMTDPSATPETYDSWVDVPGIQKLTLRLNVTSLKELRGDNQVLCHGGGKPSTVEVSADNAVISIDAMEAIMPGTASEGGATPNETVQFIIDNTTSPHWFKLAGVAGEVDGGSVMVVTYKLRLDSFDFELSDENFVIPKFSAKGVANAAGTLLLVQVFETYTEIS